MRNPYSDLPERIAACCRLDTRPLPVRLREALGLLTAGTDARERLFEIPRPASPLRIVSRQEFDGYLDKLLDLRELRSFAETYQDAVGGIIPKTVLKMAEQITASQKPVFQDDGCGAEQLAEYVRKRVLERHVKKISETLYSQSGLDGGRTAKGLIRALNRYLERLGVYTVIVRPGMLYLGTDAERFYEAITEHQSEDISTYIIEEVIRPAYMLDYIDEDGALTPTCLEGSCILVRRKSNGIH